MGDHCIRDESSGIRKRIGKGKKALYERLLLIRRPLGALSHWVRQVFLRGARKYIRSPERFSTRRMNCGRPILPDQKQHMVSPMKLQGRSHASLSCPGEHLCPPGTEGHGYDASYPQISSPRSCVIGRSGTHQIQGGSPTSTVGSCQSNVVINLCNSPGSPQSVQFQRPRLQGGPNCVLSTRFHAPQNQQALGGSNSAIAPEDFHRTLQQLRKEVAGHAKTRQELQAARNEKNELEARLRVSKNFVQELNCRLHDAEGKVVELEQLKIRHESDRDILEATIVQKDYEMLSFSERVTSTVAELEKISREHESCAKPSAKPEAYVQRNAICGYADEFATPSLLDTALSKTKAAVRRFQNAFSEAIKHNCDPASIENLLKPDAHFARSSHISFAVRAAVYDVFFEGFENESFSTFSGVSRFLDPGVRQIKFYEYYLQVEQNHSSDLRDPQYEAFCEMKVPLLWEKFNLLLEKKDTSSMQVACLEALGGSQLVSSFRVAAMNVWLLHKLAFSFEPPASIFRVEQGAVDLDCMEPMVNLEDSQRFVNEVGFMIAPGFRIRKAVLRCEIYLAGATTIA